MTTKQCGNCQFWDHKSQENAVSDCLYDSYPKCFERDDKMPMACEEGNDCPVYVERQDAHEGDDDPPDENGYTRADEDWFFDDKDD